MKILWLCSYPLQNLNNIPVKHRRKNSHPATWLVNLSSQLLKYQTDIELHIVSENTNISKDFDLEQDGIYFHFIRSGSAIPYLNRGYPRFFPIDLITNYRKSYFKYKNKIKEIRPDLIHSHGTETICSLVAVESGLPNIISIQGLMNLFYKMDKSLRGYINKRNENKVFSKGKYFIGKSIIAEQEIRKVNIDAIIYQIQDPISDIYLTNENIIHNNKIYKIIFTANLTKTKGIEFLFEVVSLLKFDFLLFVAGKGEKRYIKYLNKKISNLGINNKIKWLGQINQKDLRQYLLNCDLFIHPTFMDNTASVVSDAMAAGIPVIANKVAGIPEKIIDMKTGFLVEPGNKSELLNKINFCYPNSAICEEIAENARKFALKNYSGEVISTQIYELYKKILDCKTTIK